MAPAEFASDIDFEVVEGSDVVSIAPNAPSGAETDIDLTSSAEGTATINAIYRPSGNIVATLEVQVLTPRTIPIGIYYVEDSTSPGTMPVGGASPDDVINTLNSVFKQAAIQFTLADSESRNIPYDGSYGQPVDGLFQGPELRAFGEAFPEGQWGGKLQVTFVKDAPGTFGGGVYTEVWGTGALAITARGSEDLIAAHEFGHHFDLSTRDVDDDSRDHDGPPWPEGTTGLMLTGRGEPPGRWMRHEDWNRAT